MEQAGSSNPVPINRLANVLKNARNLIDKVETGDYETGNIDARALTEEGVKEMASEGKTAPRMQRSTTNDSMGVPVITKERIMSSKMPSAIKKLMLERPIPQATMTNSFSLDDVKEAMNDEEYERTPKYPTSTPKKKAAPQPIRETQYAEQMAGLSEPQVRKIIREEIIEFLATYFTKSLTEEVQRKVINWLRVSRSP